MYINDVSGEFIWSREDQNAVINLLPPVYVEDGKEYQMELFKDTENKRIYENKDYVVELTIEQKDDNLFYFRRIWKNKSGITRRIQTSFRVESCFQPEKYLIPCVNFNGNDFGQGSEPKGLEKDGKKWIFAYDREAIPSCTLVENASYACALFASDEDAASLESSCSIFRNGDRFCQELIHPVIEAPLTYAYRDRYEPAYETFVAIEPQESFVCGMYLCISRPRWKNFGICDTLDKALTILGKNCNPPTADKKKIWEDSITFAKSLITEYKGKKGFIIGFLPDGNGGFAYREDSCFELGWCGQNVLLSRMLIEDAIRNGHKENLELALEILDTRVKYCVAETGLLAAQLRDYENLMETASDTCNMGYGAYELLRTYERLLTIHIDKKEYFQAAKGLCDFFCEAFSDDYGFGKLWRHDGVCLDEKGSIGAFVICPLAKLYQMTKERKYLEAADRALEFYMEESLNQFSCTAGALDTCCVDKETSFPFLASAILLYEGTNEKKYLEYGKKAAYYFTSWMFHYQPVYKKESEVATYQVCIKGLTSVSAQHHHLDMYAGIVVPYMRKLARYTGEEQWNQRAEWMLDAALQYIGDGELVIHDVKRPVGSQNEALFQCRWSFDGSEKGKLNDWLVAWPCAFRLSALAEE